MRSQPTPSFILQEELLETSRLKMKVFTETPVDGLTWHEGYSDPCLVINLKAQLQSFEVAADQGDGYRGPVVPGDFSFLPPHAAFGGHYRGIQMCYACITFPKERLNPRFASGKPKIMHTDPLLRTFAAALYSHRHRQDPDVILYRDSLTEALVNHLQLVHLKSDSLSETQHPNLERLQSYIQENLDQKLTVTELATFAQTTPQSLQRATRKRFGQSVYEWVTTLRLERSLELLRSSSFGLAEIAIISGFAHQSHWTRLFRRQFGITPGKLRSS